MYLLLETERLGTAQACMSARRFYVKWGAPIHTHTHTHAEEKTHTSNDENDIQKVYAFKAYVQNSHVHDDVFRFFFYLGFD